MGTFVVKGRPTWLGEYDLSLYSPTIAIDYGAEPVDDTVLSDTTRSVQGGLKTFGFSMDVHNDPAVEGVSFANVSANVPLTLGSVDGTAQEVAYLINCYQLASNPLSGTVGDMAGMNITGNTQSNLVRGLLEFNGTAVSSSTSTGSQLGFVTAGKTIYANLHCTAASAADTLDVIVQSDDNSGITSASTRLTFTQVSGGTITSQHLSLDGNIANDDYWRISYTIAGSDTSFTFAVSIGIL